MSTLIILDMNHTLILFIQDVQLAVMPESPMMGISLLEKPKLIELY